MTGNRLVHKLKKGKHKTLQSFYKENAARYKYLLYRYVGNESIAEDLLQDGFMRIFNKIDQFKGSGSFDGWARRIIINTALEYLRKNKKQIFSDIELINPIKLNLTSENQAFVDEIDIKMLPSDEINMDVIHAANFSDEELEEALNHLPEHYRVVFNLYSIDGYKHREIAKLLGINEKTSKSRLSKARKITRAYLYKEAIEIVKRKQNEAR